MPERLATRPLAGLGSAHKAQSGLCITGKGALAIMTGPGTWKHMQRPLGSSMHVVGASSPSEAFSRPPSSS